MMSATARRLLAQHAIEADPSILNLSYALAAEGPLDADAFAWALMRLIDSYPSLGPPLRNGEVVRQIDVSGHTPAERGRIAAVSMACERTTPFELDLPPLLRAVIIRLTRDRHVLLMTFHHAIADSWMLSQYAGFISRSYAAVTAGDQLADVRPADLSRHRDPTARLAAERVALEGTLTGLTRKECDPFPPIRPGALLRWSVALDASAAAALQEAAVAQRITRFSLLAAAVADAVCARANLASLVLGTTVLNRYSSADLAIGEARYQGAIFRARSNAAASPRETGSAVAAAVERMMPYEEQLMCLRAATGGREDIAPAVFVMLDSHPMSALQLAAIAISSVMPAKEPTVAPCRAHSPRCGRIALFMRESGRGSTLNMFAEEGLAAYAQPLFDAVQDNLARSARIAQFSPVLAIPWEAGLARIPAPPVEALSPVCLPARASAEEMV